MASTELIKKIASCIEIFIIYIIFLVLAIKSYSTHKVAEIKKDWIKHRQNPILLPFSGLFGKSPGTVLNGIIGQTIGKMFSKIKSFFYNIFGLFNKIFGGFQVAINEIRNLTKPIRLFFKKAAQMFYKKLENVMIGVSYTMHKIRNSLRRTISGFNMAFHTLNAIQLSLRSIMNSPMIGILKKFLPAIDWVSGTLNTLGFCFSTNSLVKTIDGYIKIIDIKPGQPLDKNNRVICTHKFKNNDDMYSYKNIIVSGSHLVNETDGWLRVKDSNISNKVNYKDEFIYCLTTTNGTITLDDNTIFKDFSESHCENVNKKINDIILKKLNGTEEVVNNGKHQYIEHGIGPNTQISLINNESIEIKDIKIGDYTNLGKVLGIIKLDPTFLEIYKYKNKYTMSGNVKVNETGLWINVCDSIYSDRIHNYKDILYHLVVENELINLNDIVICDYMECHDKCTNKEIDDLVNNYCNI